MITAFNFLKLRAAIAESGQDQRELAQKIGVTETTVSRWVNGHTWPQPHTLCRLLGLLGWDSGRIGELKLVDFYPLDKQKDWETT